MEQKNNTTSRKSLKIFLGLFFCIVLIGAGTAYYLYNEIFGINLQLAEDTILTIPKGSTLEQLASMLEQQQIVKEGGSFLFTANQRSYKLTAGKYKIPKSTTTNYNLVTVLQGHQLAIKLTFHNFRIKEQLAAYIGSKIGADSLEFIQLLEDAEFLEESGYTPETVMAVFIPNTYEVYWNCSAEDFWKRMLRENKKFWTEERLQKAKELELSPSEVYTLASIVECESQYKPERPRIAGVYLNRLKTEGWKLEADPTVIFAVGDFSIRRVLDRHLAFESPYNTYLNRGLPPGPIYMSSMSSIDAVLNAEKHNYMFFCAKPYEEGQPYVHAFAKTLNAHLRNAKIYWRWLRSQ